MGMLMLGVVFKAKNSHFLLFFPRGSISFVQGSALALLTRNLFYLLFTSLPPFSPSLLSLPSSPSHPPPP